MAGNHDYVALDWVKGEIESTLLQAQQMLEDYVANTDDTTTLRFCVNYIHQVHGTLQMVEFYGAALLAEEMEKVGEALHAGEVQQQDDALEALSKAILQLPNYLERLQRSKRDLPMVLLPLLNDLRASRGERLLSDTALFSPDLALAKAGNDPGVIAQLQDPRSRALIRKLRQMYQFTLVSVVRESELEANLANLVKVLSRLRQMCKGTAHAELWRLGLGLIEAMQSGNLAPSSAVKTLLRLLDGRIKLLVEQPAQAFGEKLPEDLLKNLLYYCAQSASTGNLTTGIKTDYALASALPGMDELAHERDQVSGPSRSTLSTIAGVLCDELGTLKDQLDLFVRGEFKSPSELGELLPGLHQVSNTMAVLGLGQPRKVIDEQISKIETLAEGLTRPDDNELLDIAGALLYVEASLGGLADDIPAADSGVQLDGLVPREQVDKAHKALIVESRNSLEMAKTAISEYVSSDWQRSELSYAPKLLRDIAGSLRIIPLPEASDLLLRCSRYIENNLLEIDESPGWQKLEALADAITSIDYYLERIAERSGHYEKILQVAAESLTVLDGQQPAHLTAQPDVSEQAPASAQSGAEIEELGFAPVQQVLSADKQTDADIIDDEIREVFAEEVAEVIATIEENRPLFEQNPQNKQALGELRRAYHTLKGSGRLVGARLLGELAWNVEDLLNKTLEGLVTPSLTLFELLGNVEGLIPDLVHSFTSGMQDSGNDAGVRDLIARAEAIVVGARTARNAGSAEQPSAESDKSTDESVDTAAETSLAQPAVVSAPSSQSGLDVELSDGDMIDDEIIEIFAEEATEVLETINQYLPDFRANYDDRTAKTELRRAFHTLKGSGRLVGALRTGELSWSIENLMNGFIEGTHAMTPQAERLIVRVVELLPVMIADFIERRPPAFSAKPLQAYAEALASGHDAPVPTLLTGDFAADVAPADPASEVTRPDMADAPSLESEQDFDPLLLEIFLSETRSHIQTINSFVQQQEGQANPLPLNDEISRALHTLKGSANTAGSRAIARIVVPLERFYRDLNAQSVPASPAVCQALTEASMMINAEVEHIEACSGEPLAALAAASDEEIEALGSTLQALATELTTDALSDAEDGVTGTHSDVVDMFRRDSIEILLDAERIINEWSAEPDKSDKSDELEALIDELTTLAAGAKAAGLAAMHELSVALEELYETVDAGYDRLTSDFFTIAKAGHEALIIMMDQVAAGLSPQQDAAVLNAIRSRRSALLDTSFETSDADIDAIPLLSDQEDFDAEVQPVAERSGSHSGSEVVATNDSGLDQEMVEIFLEEAHELLESSAQSLARWRADLGDLSQVESLQRDAHTLKGGARMADLDAIGDLSHELETLFERIVEGRLSVSTEALDVSSAAHLALGEMIAQTGKGLQPLQAPALIARITDVLSGGSPDLQHQAIHETADLSFSADSAGGSINDEADIDQEIVELFLQEARDIIHSTAETIQQWRETPDEHSLIASLQRDLHTLKGGARMADIAPVGDLAHELETLFESMAERGLQPSPETSGQLADLVETCHDRLTGMIDQLGAAEAVEPAPELVAAMRQFISDLDASSEPSPDVAVPQPVEPARQGAVVDFGRLDMEIVDLYLEEASELIDETGENLRRWIADHSRLPELHTLQRTMHTLKGGARLAEVSAIGDLAHEFETLIEGIVENTLTIQPLIEPLLLDVHDRLAMMVESLGSREEFRSAPELIKAVRQYAAQNSLGDDPLRAIALEQAQLLESGASQAELRHVFIDESDEILQVALDAMDSWKQHPEAFQHIPEVSRRLRALARGAGLAGLIPLQSLADNHALMLETISEHVSADSFLHQDEVIELSDRALQTLREQIREIASAKANDSSAGDGLDPAVMQAITIELSLLQRRLLGDSYDGNETQQPGLDPEILSIFMEESGELEGLIVRHFGDWQQAPSDTEHGRKILLALHTLKGGARLTGLPVVGDLAQSLEDKTDRCVKDPSLFDEAMSQQLAAELEWLRTAIQGVRSQADELIRRTVELAQRQGETISRRAESDVRAEQMVQLQRGQRGASEAEPKAPATVGKPAKAPAQRQQSVETIRVSAQLLDNLVNLAGETSITRGRLETQISDFTHTLEEMQATIDRLREQLRRMDIETEAQVLFRMEKEGGGPVYEDFDPLEMDRYSSIQQLSRALSESASDLADLRETLLDKSKDAETLLLQQSRINTELQEGLMETRMIPFTSIVPRLRRIVRQVTGELGKKADFEVSNAEGELDRNVLDRIVAPLEHMLRNALDHGVEMPEQRRAAGKSETGRISLTVGREGSDVVLTLSDDGGGINTEAVRKKAIKQGLISRSTEIADSEILQFIFHAGFSTAEKVTQLSGRGVGMDVVASEIKQLGGRVTIESKAGKGTIFTVRLPFTVSVNRALMVSTGDDYYAIPLNTIEGIVRVSTFELEEFYQPNAPLYEYAGQKYQLQYLGSLLRSDHHPKLQGQPLPLPVILVRGGDRPLALQVDSLLGSREIVVKGLGPQFSTVRGVSGGTILGDGSVVVILDLPALMRSDQARLLAQDVRTEREVSKQSGPVTVMVVDDSVTVRKVTTRLLERQGMRVITAKDGIDAIAILQDQIPDVMLLDIEMPRMDGFEVASFVRHDERLRDVPIIMITSRTGQKHRDRALSIGVNEYLGKPFQESVLLETIGRHID